MDSENNPQSKYIGRNENGDPIYQIIGGRYDGDTVLHNNLSALISGLYLNEKVTQ